MSEDLKAKMFVTYGDIAKYLGLNKDDIKKAGQFFKQQYGSLHPNIDGFVRGKDGVMNYTPHIRSGFPRKLEPSHKVSVEKLLEALRDKNNHIQIERSPVVETKPLNESQLVELKKLVAFLKVKFGEDVIARMAKYEGLLNKPSDANQEVDDIEAFFNSL